MRKLKRMTGFLSAAFLCLSLTFTAACQYESGPYGSGEDGKKKEELYLLYLLLLAQSKKSENGGSGSSGSAY